MKKSAIVTLTLSLTLILASLYSEAVTKLSPTQVIQNLWKQVSSISPTIDSESRKEFIKTQLRSTYDFDTFYEVALQDHWAFWSQQQRQEFSQKFEGIFLQSLIKKLAKLPRSGGELKEQTVDTKGNRSEAIFKGKKGQKECDFRVFFSHRLDGWKIYDVEVEGVLLSRNYRAQFNRILRRENFEGLLARLDKKVQNSGGNL